MTEVQGCKISLLYVIPDIFVPVSELELMIVKQRKMDFADEFLEVSLLEKLYSIQRNFFQCLVFRQGLSNLREKFISMCFDEEVHYCTASIVFSVKSQRVHSLECIILTIEIQRRFDSVKFSPNGVLPLFSLEIICEGLSRFKWVKKIVLLFKGCGHLIARGVCHSVDPTLIIGSNGRSNYQIP